MAVLMCTRRCARAPALLAPFSPSAAASAARCVKLLLLWLVDMRDVQLLLHSLASEARENESRDCALAALSGSSASACMLFMSASTLLPCCCVLCCCSSSSASSAPLSNAVSQKSQHVQCSSALQPPPLSAVAPAVQRKAHVTQCCSHITCLHCIAAKNLGLGGKAGPNDV